MILITGGICQGQAEFAKTFGIPDERIIYDAHEVIRDLMRSGKDAETDFFAMADGAQIVTCCDIGMGIVPADAFEREWREAVGRTMCKIAADAEEVYVMNCGIPQKIKG